MTAHDGSNSPADELPRVAAREPGEIVLRAEPVVESADQTPIGQIEYNRQAPDLRKMFPYGVNWVRVCLAGFLLLVVGFTVVAFMFLGPIPHHHNPRARTFAAKSDLDSLATAIADFQKDTGQLPSQDAALKALLQQPVNPPGWMGPYITRLPQDPWRTPYQYRFPGVHNTGTYDLSSAGPDKTFGTGDDLGIGRRAEERAAYRLLK